MKRLFDVLVSIISILTLLPVFITVACILKLDGGPIFFKQTRVGKAGKEFQIYKFRSMVVNASQLGGFSTNTNDSRITPVGKFIRKTSIDELPQLINVIKGEMSIVGPRPNVPMQRDCYTLDNWNKRNSVLPGITGLAQATSRSLATSEERLSLDLEYIDRFGFVLDLKIILLTIKQIVLKGGN